MRDAGDEYTKLLDALDPLRHHVIIEDTERMVRIRKQLVKRDALDDFGFRLRQTISKRKTPESEDSGVLEAFESKERISAWRTEERDVRPSDRTSFFPSFWGRGS